MDSGAEVTLLYTKDPSMRRDEFGTYLTVDPDGLVTDMEEKPAEPKSHHVTPPFYIYGAKDIPLILGSIDNGCKWDAPGNLAGYISRTARLHALRMPGTRKDIGSLEGYYALKDAVKVC